MAYVLVLSVNYSLTEGMVPERFTVVSCRWISVSLRRRAAGGEDESGDGYDGEIMVLGVRDGGPGNGGISCNEGRAALLRFVAKSQWLILL